LHFFAFPENSTLFFSIASALFVKNNRGWGDPASLYEEKMKPQSAELGIPAEVGEVIGGFLFQLFGAMLRTES
jgi:hypothetical protein